MRPDSDMAMLLRPRDLGDETGDVALDLVRWQVVAGAGVRLAEIAADDEGAQPGVGKAFRLRDAESADGASQGGGAWPPSPRWTRPELQR